MDGYDKCLVMAFEDKTNLSFEQQVKCVNMSFWLMSNSLTFSLILTPKTMLQRRLSESVDIEFN